MTMVFDAEFKIVTARLELVPIGPRHAARIIEAKDESMAEIGPWMAWAEGDSPDSTRAFAVAAAKAWEEGTGWEFVLFHDGAVAGVVGFNRYEPLLRAASIGYWIRSSLAGRGLMTEAVSAAVEFAFETLGLHRIELVAAPGNRGSVRVAEKNGFRRGGTLRDGSRGVGGYHDVWVFDLLEGDERPRLHRARPKQQA